MLFICRQGRNPRKRERERLPHIYQCVDSPLRAWSALRENLEIKYVIGLRLLSCLLYGQNDLMSTVEHQLYMAQSVLNGMICYYVCVCVCDRAGNSYYTLINC